MGEAQNEGIDNRAVYDALNVDPEFVQESDELSCLNTYLDECFRDDDDEMYYDTGLVE